MEETVVKEGGGGEEIGVKDEEEDYSKDLQQQSKALDKLTDHHHHVVDDQRRQHLDSTRVQEAMASIAAPSKQADDFNAYMRLRDKELAAVKINPAEVDIIANELELDKKVAERGLREHKGDAVAAIRHLIHSR